VTAVVSRVPSSRQAATRPAEDPRTSRRWANAEALTCALVLLSLGVRFYLPSQIALGFLLMLVTAPAWLGVLRCYRFANLLAAIILTSIVFGIGLTTYSLASRYVTRTSLVSEVTLVLLTFGGAGVVLWGRERLGSRATAVLFAVGLLAGAALHGHSATQNGWKGAWAIPVTTLLLALTYRRLLASLVVVAGLAIVCVVNDTRALASVLVVSMLLLVWQLRAPAPRARTSFAWTGMTMGVLGVLAYYLGQAALVRGLLGAQAQARSIQQIDQAGSLILGGRPEITATAALIAAHPWGYGFGVAPRNSDVLIAKTGMARINYDPNNGYVDRFMFGSGFELHSVLGDIWVRMGPLGLLLLAVVVVVLVASLARRLGARHANGLVLFLVLWAFWNMLFSPLLSAALPLTLAIGMALLRVDDPPLESRHADLDAAS